MREIDLPRPCSLDDIFILYARLVGWSAGAHFPLHAKDY